MRLRPIKIAAPGTAPAWLRALPKLAAPVAIEAEPGAIVATEEVSPVALRIHRGLVWLARIEDFLHTLHIYGSLGIACFGWAICRLLQVPAEPWVPLWFCAGMLIYNLDRWRRDPADEINTPQRAVAARKWRKLTIALTLVAGMTLLLIPLAQHDWMTFWMVLLATPVCLNHAIPFRNQRLKDVPLLKTFFAPAMVMLAIIALPLAHTPRAFPLLATPLIFAWGFGLALANMLLCDLRDIAGDRRTGVRSLPAEIGPAATRRLVWALALVTGGLAGLLVLVSAQPTRGAWVVLSIAATVYISALALATLGPRSERFYERWVEGLLFLPALVVAFFL